MTASREIDLVNLPSGVTILTFNRPAKKNALTIRMYEILVEAFSRAEMLSSECVLVKGRRGGIYVPAAKIHEFQFTGTTEF